MRAALAAALLVSCGARTDLGGTHPLPDGATSPEAFVQVACGEHHTCARREDGAVFCWGLDTSEQTGAPESATSPPVRVALGPATSIGLGAYHSCAIVGARVSCWGDDLVGQLASDVPTSAEPLDVGVAQATAVSGGFSHTCALLETGAIACWGQGAEGQLGDGETYASPAPVGALLTHATAIARSAGASQHTCAIVSSGSVLCWGSNVEGEIGAGDGESTAKSPTLAIVSGAVGVAVADYSSCAVMSDGALRCWGQNDRGQLGDGTKVSSSVPVTAKASGVRAVAVGPSHTCALEAGGRVECWGDNLDGELGDGTTKSSPSPVVAMDAGATDLCAGGNHTCATTQDGRVLCWGLGTSGELGAPVDHALSPEAVQGL